MFSDALAGAKIPALDVASRYSELGEALLPLINPAIGAKYGLEMTTFIVENVSVPPEVEQAIDKRSSMAAVGNLNDYVKFQMAQGLEKGGGGPGGMAAEMAVGMAMAQQMMNQTGGIMAQSTPRRRRARGAAAGTPELLHAGAGRAGARRRRGRRHGEPRSRRPEGQEDRHAVARHARGGRCVPERMSVESQRSRAAATALARRCSRCVACVALAPRAALAQDPRARARSQQAARDWLALVDKLDAEASWKAAGARFQDATAAGCWARAAASASASRAARSCSARSPQRPSATRVPGLPEGGSYALVTFRTAFAKKADSVEDVTLEVGADDVWRVIGYVIR